MGYTHYWYRPLNENFDEVIWGKFTKDVKMLAEATKKNVVLADAFGERAGKQIINKTQVCFNGWRENSHETFRIKRVCPKQPDYREDKKEYFDFCKTARKPYDIMVTSCLLRLKHYFPQVSIHSDGNIAEWQDSLNLVRSLFNDDMTEVLKAELNKD